MFDIGFAELVIIAVVALLVIGPERLPDAVRTVSAWVNRFRRGFNEIKQEVQQELHNDAVMRELRESGEKLRRETESLRQDLNLKEAAADLQQSFTETGTDTKTTSPSTRPESETGPDAAESPAPLTSEGAPASGSGTDFPETEATDEASEKPAP
jgi:sec-independent protein translocase protein TatB